MLVEKMLQFKFPALLTQDWKRTFVLKTLYVLVRNLRFLLFYT